MSDVKKAQQKAKEIKKNLKNVKYDVSDLKFMSSLSEAILAKSTSASKIMLVCVFIAFSWFLLWASFAEIDELTRGVGKIVPSGQNQVIQNLEGGIVSEILVHEGDEVKRGQILLKIDNKTFESTYAESQARLNGLVAKSLRLDAQANKKDFIVDEKKYEDMIVQIRHEKSLYDTKKLELDQKLNILNEQIRQRNNELRELNSRINQLSSSYKLMLKEVNITQPLFKKGLVSEVEFLQLKRQANSLKGELDAARISSPRIKSTIAEAENKIKESKLAFRNEAKRELNEVLAEIERINQSQVGLEDKVKRTLVKSPVTGTIARMMVNTVSGVVKPGMDLIEIVPKEDTLIAEVNVKPADVAFLKPGLKAVVKFTAYDFSIYGGLEGALEQISADTVTNRKGESFFIVRIKTNRNYLGSKEKPLKIIVGMTVSADIVTGKKTVLDYLLKPILKAKQAALRER